MLGSYMEDIGIKPKQFEEACGKGSKRSFQHGLFEQVNIDINYIRLQLICVRFGQQMILRSLRE